MNTRRRFLNRTGQAMVETLLIIVVVTSVAFGTLQFCIMAMDDMICNEAAFAGLRSAVVSTNARLQDNAAACARQILVMHFNRRNMQYEKTTVWNDTILGKRLLDHSARDIKKYNINIRYHISLAFASLIAPAMPGATVMHTARARMVKSPDEDYYLRAYPGAPGFTDKENE